MVPFLWKQYETIANNTLTLILQHMFFFNYIALTQFRNYLFQSFNFNERVIGICGANGSGKTNLLDAVHYLCFTKSYFSRADSQSVYNGLQGFRIEGEVINNHEHFQLVCVLRENSRKEFSINNEEYKKFSLHIGKFPCVMIAPDDVELITGSSEERRKFVDTILSQLNTSYLQYLIDYNKILQQRNGLLKAAAEHNRLDESLLDILDNQLCEKGGQLFFWRDEFMRSFIPLVQKEYCNIAGNNDAIELEYSSQLSNTSFKQLLNENRSRDMYLQRTGCGIHKDDIEIKMGGQAFKSVASQGQRKSLLFALKLAEFNTLEQHKGFAPVLLLDDVFEKLDAQRMQNLLQKVCCNTETQVFITDTHKERLQQAFESLDVKYQLIKLED